MPATPKNTKKAEIKGSPTGGCLIILAAAVSMIFLVGFTIWVYFAQKKELQKFTETTAKPTPVAENAEVTLAKLKKRWQHFTEANKETDQEPDSPTTFLLSRDDLNTLVASVQALQELRGKFYIEEINDKHASIRISYNMNAEAFSGNERYLNGLMYATPRVENGEILCTVEKLVIPGKEVPAPFLDVLSQHQVTASAKEHETIRPWAERLAEAKTSPEGLKLIFKNKPKPLTKEDLAPALRKTFILIAFIASLFVLFLIIFLCRKTNKKSD